MKKCRSKTPPLDAIKHVPDSLVEPSQLTLDEPEDLHEPIADVEPSDVPPGILSRPTHSEASQRVPPNPRGDVKLHPFYFHSACRLLKFKPTVDLFASAANHQIARHYTLDTHDRNAACVDAFIISWTDEFRPYINYPWSLVGRVLTKIANEGVTAMVIIPDWINAPWHPLWNRLLVRSTVFYV